MSFTTQIVSPLDPLSPLGLERESVSSSSKRFDSFPGASRSRLERQGDRGARGGRAE